MITIDCAGIPPTYFNGSTYDEKDQLPSLYKGVVDTNDVVAVQVSGQANNYVSLDVIERELSGYEFVGAHVAECYQRPENREAFLAVCPSGYLVFLEKYSWEKDEFVVVCLFVHDGVVCSSLYNYAYDGFGDEHHFAVRRKLNV